MSLCIFDQNNTSAAVNGTATVSIKDAQSALLYQNTIAFVESDFQNVSTPNGGELTKSWQVGYGEMDSSASKGGDLVCSIAVATGEWNLAAANDSVSLPSVLSIFKLH